MFSIDIDKIVTRHVEDKIKKFYKELEDEFKVALVSTRDDFITRVASLLGSVPAEGGNVPSPYVAFWPELSSGWMEKKRLRGYFRNIGTATGETIQWLLNFADNPGQVIKAGGFMEIVINPLSSAPDEVAAKISMMEFGGVWTDPGGNAHTIPPRKIFRPVVIWYDTQGTGSPFYREALQARNRAMRRVFGNA